MINPTFYTPKNVKKGTYANNDTRRYDVRPKAIVLTSYPYVIKYGDTMYSLAKLLFGEENEYLWTVIADINPLRYPDEWEPGETILLPELIVQETFVTDRTFK